MKLIRRILKKKRLAQIQKKNNLKPLDPNYVTGFVDAEGCFHISLRKKSVRKVGYAVDLSFSIGLDTKDKELLILIKAFFQDIGILSVHENVVRWRVRSIEDLKILLNHFDSYPLITKKKIDYYLFKQAFQIIINKEHLTEVGLLKLIAIRASINKGLSEVLREAFPGLVLNLWKFHYL